MQFRAAVAVTGALLAGAGVWAQQSGAPPPARAGAAVALMSDAAQNALVDEYCATCHSRAAKSGDLVLEGFNVASPLLGAELLERMIRKMRAGLMPPAKAERPEPAAAAAFVTALERRADAMAARADDPGWRPFPRLNRAEYARTIKDLLGLDIDPSAILPPDTISGGFDNIADVQTASPALITSYLRGAAAISTAALHDAASRRKVLTCLPRSAADEAACASAIVGRLTATAYRGAATDVDVSDALGFYARGRARGGFEDGIRLALQSILVSPKFLFRLESAGPDGTLDDVALASRLSFFLWSSGPDETLVAAARRRALHTPAQLASAARRMTRDHRAETLSTRFAAEWLRLQDLDRKTDPALAADMRKETELFVADIIRRDAPVTELITSNRSFVNERLAKIYGVPNVRGEAFRPVTLPDDRRGLLGQASVLTLTSLVTRSSPVLRGKWVLDVLLGTPPPLPPPNVPALDDSVKPERDGVPLSTRQRVEAHRQNPSCSGCHRVIDPAGMALEHFDATGGWRDTDNGVPIDAVADLYDGRRMDGAAGVRAALVAHEDMVLRNFTQQLMTYALGRRLSYRDMPAVRAIVRRAAAEGNRISAFLTGVVESDAFRRVRPPEAP